MASKTSLLSSVLIPSWVKSRDNDLIQLLIGSDIQTDIELIEKMFESIESQESERRLKQNTISRID